MTSLVILSHSKKIAEGIKEVAEEMARATDIYAVGGTNDGSIGSDYDKMKDCLITAAEKGNVIVLFDLGSTLMTVQMVIDELSELQRSKVFLVDAALVEGAIVAAISINADMSVEEILDSLKDLKLNKM